ncbi:molybdopterin-binding protein [Pseudooceanicola sp. HF7]|uniref:molybdopterin-binding protein n=1 Tax=Pseudooceanicola sp. HF7 TaxID=2721560 RepID=UPI00143217CE|nr:molybdopterin-binding protein [Pseudooceanicola sp. HF7]NIZ09252.1 molybdopterin-binding protein [Pseudooceanicola sp. HF7]
MRFGPVPLAQAEGALLAHSMRLPEGRLRKGALLGAAELHALAAAGVEEVIVARLDPGDVAEDAAAETLARALVADRGGLRLGRAGTGRVNIYADGPGLAQVDARKVRALNAVEPMITLATVPEWQRVAERTMVATVKIISYAVPGAALEAACAAGAGALCLRPMQHRRVGLILTRIDGQANPEAGRDAVELRVTRLGGRLVHAETVAHEGAALAAALRRAADVCDAVLILTGSATSDPQDVAPGALRAAGGQVTRFGMPVDPGNLLFFGALGDLPVIGLPGCARAPALNGADWVLERMLCGQALEAEDIAAMGVGGLLKEIPTRPQPRDPK